MKEGPIVVTLILSEDDASYLLSTFERDIEECEGNDMDASALRELHEQLSEQVEE